MVVQNSIRFIKENFTFDYIFDVPGITTVVVAFVANIVSWAGKTEISPIFTYIMTGLAIVYLFVKIFNAILTSKSIQLDNKLKKKKLETQ